MYGVARNLKSQKISKFFDIHLITYYLINFVY
jgi:DNA-directed RNA polymerase III subunit RPC6